MADDQVSLVKQANDIVEVIGEYLSLHKKGRTFKGLCPFHDDHHPSLDVDPAKQRFTCWACGKFGDVFTFIMERERVDFREALEVLARRANIQLRRGGSGQEGQERVQMLDLMKWAEEQYHRYLSHSSGADSARNYLSQRSLRKETLERYAVGYAPDSWTWLSQTALKAGWSSELLIKVGLAAPREADGSLYDRFRDRVMFPIRDGRGRTVGFGGRILPTSSSSATAPKYYNSSDTPLFTKSEHLYGLDQARAAGEAAGYLAVVEGYTDVLMAHQHGVMPVVATLGTALNVRHIVQLRRLVPRVILVFDADAGGENGVDRALELFVSQDVDLAVATLPAELDPCDLLVQEGPGPFQAALDRAVNALDFKLNQVLTPSRLASIEGRRDAIEKVLRVLALAPEMPGPAGALKRELIVNRIATLSRVDEELVWERLAELRRTRRGAEAPQPPKSSEQSRKAPADPAEKELLQVLLAEPELVGRAVGGIVLEDLEHPGLRQVLEVMYELHSEGLVPNVDRIRYRLAENSALGEHVLKLQAEGNSITQRGECLVELIALFRRREVERQMKELRGQLQNVPTNGPPPSDLLRQLQGKHGHG